MTVSPGQRSPLDTREIVCFEVSKRSVTLTNATPRASKSRISPAKSTSDRERRSSRYTAITSTRPAATSAKSRWNPGRSVVAPLNPPSSVVKTTAR